MNQDQLIILSDNQEEEEEFIVLQEPVQIKEDPNKNVQSEFTINSAMDDINIQISSYKTQENLIKMETQIFEITIHKKNTYHKYTIYRRYSDFEWLKAVNNAYQMIQFYYPGLLTLGFPQKNITSYFLAKFNIFKKQLKQEFIRIRMYQLSNYLQGLLHHRKLRYCKQLKQFLQQNKSTFQIYKQSTQTILSNILQQQNQKNNGILNYLKQNSESLLPSYLNKKKQQRSKYQDVYSLNQDLQMDKIKQQLIQQLQNYYKNMSNIAETYKTYKTYIDGYELLEIEQKEELSQQVNKLINVVTTKARKVNDLQIILNRILTTVSCIYQGVQPYAYYLKSYKNIIEILERREIMIQKMLQDKRKNKDPKHIKKLVRRIAVLKNNFLSDLPNFKNMMNNQIEKIGLQFFQKMKPQFTMKQKQIWN